VVLLGRVGVLDRQGVGPREEVGANQGGRVLVGAGRGVFRVGWGELTGRLGKRVHVHGTVRAYGGFQRVLRLGLAARSR